MSEETLCHKDFNWLFLLSKYDELRLGNFLRLYASHLHVFSFHFKLSILTIIDLCLKQIISRILSSFFLFGGGGFVLQFYKCFKTKCPLHDKPNNSLMLFCISALYDMFCMHGCLYFTFSLFLNYYVNCTIKTLKYFLPCRLL